MYVVLLLHVLVATAGAKRSDGSAQIVAVAHSAPPSPSTTPTALPTSRGAHAADASTSSRSLIMVEGAQAADSDDLDPDDFLWETLPGRCCFYGGPDPLDPSKWLGAHTCDECTVWDLPNNFCHSSASACAECGMTLYCGRTPPLIAGNKVCTGSSRVGHGCEDTLGTGVCATHSLSECQEQCRNHPKCEMLVFYPQERQGTCILCADVSLPQKPLERCTSRHLSSSQRNQLSLSTGRRLTHRPTTAGKLLQDHP